MTETVPRLGTLSCAELHIREEAEHYMGMPALRKRRWTAADVRAFMDESRAWPRYELLDGELLVTNAPTMAHQIAVAELLRQLGQYVDAERVGIAMTSPSDIELEPEQITQPDVFVVPVDLLPADAPIQWRHISRLLLAVEVLSPSTMREDRVRKRDFYLRNRVDEYWIVDLDARVFERWTPASERPDIRRDTLDWTPAGAQSAFRLDVAMFFETNRGLKRFV